MADFNSMQANLGLIPGSGPTTQVKSPAQAAAELSQQASMQIQQAQQTMQIARPTSSMFTFGQQYQQQFQAAQAQSSYGPYAASMLGSFTQPSALPSPLMMTPAHTGVFRPPMPYGSGAGGSPMSPMPVMPMFQTPFTPQLPTPNFRTPWEQEVQQRELRADQLYSMTSQAPRFGGMAAGYGMGAMAGAAVGGRFGAVGRGVGAVLGGVGAHMSGFAGGMGQMAMWPMRPGLEAHSMGLAAQRMSQDWVVGGPNLHELGRGLSRDASMSMGRSIQNLAENRGFKQETRGMFNRHDLTNILEQSGKSGLMDFDQSVGQIQDRLRQVSRTVSRFMELTNDPDVTSVIKRMGQMRTFGMSLPEIEQAASSMRTFSRAAGTTVGGLWQQGLPGAMTYQALGLSGGAGMQYGMYSAAMARQSVASGTYNEAQLAMLGGVQGVAQRNMQAQGAMMSMPLFGASVGTYGQGGWGLNGASLAGVSRGGPQGMVLGAVGNMNAAVQAGGIGALAMMPLQQRQIQDQAARTMSPYEQTAMRFNMASQTGKFLGLSGAGGFAAGARLLYGDEVAEQMLLEASNPQYWKSQKRMIQQERDTLARQQRQEIQDAAPGFMVQAGRDMATAASITAQKALGPVSDLTGIVKRGWRDAITRPLQEIADREAGVVTFDKLDPGMSADMSTKEGRKAFKARQAYAAKYGQKTKLSGDIQMSGQQALESAWRTGMGDESGNWTGVAIGALPWALGGIGGGIDAGLAMAGVDTGGLMKEGLGNAFLAFANSAGGHHKSALLAVQERDRRMSSLFEGSANRRTYGKEASSTYSGLEKALGLKAGEGRWAVSAGSQAIARKADSAGSGLVQGYLSEESIQQSMASGIALRTGVAQDKVLAALQSMPEDQYKAVMETGLGNAGAVGTDTAKATILATQERARGNTMRGSLMQSRESMEAIRSQMDKRTKSWGLTKGSSDELNKLLAKYDPTQVAAIMANLSGNTKRSAAWETALVEDIKKNNKGISDEAAADMASKMMADVGTGGVSDTLRKQMGAVISVGGRGIQELREQIGDIGTVQTNEMAVRAMSSIGKEVGASFGSTQQILGMAAGDIKKLGKNAKFSGLAGALQQYQKSTGDRSGLAQQVMEQLVTLGEETGDSQSTVVATGDKAKQLNVAEATLADTAETMKEAFKYFNAETTKTFQTTVNLFHEAVSIDARNKGLGTPG